MIKAMQLNVELLILMRQPSRSSAQLLLTVLNQTAQQIISTAGSAGLSDSEQLVTAVLMICWAV
jgi:hypothetical protein